jgi:hypothetical protein
MSSTIATIGIVCVACCAASTAASPEAMITLAFLGDQLSGQFGQSLGMSLGEPELDADVAVIDLPERCQCIPKNTRERLNVIWGVDAQNANEREVFRTLRK